MREVCCWYAGTSTPEALDLLRRAHERAADNAPYAYVYAIALNSTGAPAEAMAVLERAHQRHPADRDVLVALVPIARGTGDFGTALRQARELVTLDLRTRGSARWCRISKNAKP